MKRKQEKTNGITLIALVITIIVLLILAAVSIATLTGDNGILTKAKTAKTQTIIAQEKEQIQLAYMAVLTKKNDSSNSIEDELNNELEKLEAEAVAKEENNLFIVTFSKTGNCYTIDNKGNITGPIKEEGNIPNPDKPAIETVKGQIFDTNTEIQDKYGNKLTIPAGFKVASDSAEEVTGGVVIEDVSNPETEKSQFVWIPVGEIYTKREHTEANKKNIRLGRYDFKEDGTPIDYSGNAKEENIKDTANLLNRGNTIAKDIETFKKSVEDNGGYYLGRYEARKNAVDQLTVKENEDVYNMVTQPQAAELSQKMYIDKSFTSDLMNSYAWDTAIVFIQMFGQSNYSRQKSLNSDFANRGTNNLTDIEKQDKQCNIWDMASNGWEWTTETPDNGNTSYRGGQFNLTWEFYTGTRSYNSVGYFGKESCFRVILYL